MDHTGGHSKVKNRVLSRKHMLCFVEMLILVNVYMFFVEMLMLVNFLYFIVDIQYPCRAIHT